MQTAKSALRHSDELDADEIAHELAKFPDWAEAVEAARREEKEVPPPTTDA